MNLTKNPLFYLSLVLVVIVGLQAWTLVQAAFQEPISAFPASDVSVPLETSSILQTKLGELQFATVAAPTDTISSIGTSGICLKEDSSALSTTCKAYWNAILGAWSVSGDDVYYNVTGGSVGIGTNTPDSSNYILDVAGSINFTGDLFQNGDLFESGGGGGTWSVSGSDVYYTAGNVGIGISYPDSKFSILASTGETALTVLGGNLLSQSLIIRPDGAGSSDNWTPVSVSNNWQAVDEDISDGDDTYVEGITVSDSYNMQTSATLTGKTIDSVEVKFRCKKVTGAPRVKATITSGGLITNGSLQDPVDVYGLLTETFSSKPSGGNWTKSDIDSLQVGITVENSPISDQRGDESLAAGSRVLMLDGSHKNIEDIQEGDYVNAFDVENYTIKQARVVGTTIGRKPHLLINNTLDVSPDHEVFVIGKGFIIAGDIQIGDFLLNEVGSEEEVEVINVFDEVIDVYDITLDSTYTFFADGYLVHNAVEDKARCTQVYAVVHYQDPVVVSKFSVDDAGDVIIGGDLTVGGNDKIIIWPYNVGAGAYSSSLSANGDSSRIRNGNDAVFHKAIPKGYKATILTVYFLNRPDHIYVYGQPVGVDYSDGETLLGSRDYSGNSGNLGQVKVSNIDIVDIESPDGLSYLSIRFVNDESREFWFFGGYVEISPI